MSVSTPNPHLSDDQLVDVLYGLGTSADQDHSEACSSCEQRKIALAQRKLLQTRTRPATESHLLRQRREVMARAAGGADYGWNTSTLAAGALAAGLVAGVFFAYGPFAGSPPEIASRAKQPAVTESVRDEADLGDVLTLEMTSEARASAPLHGLFELAEGNQ